MGSYRGPAEVVTAEGETIDVEADLVAPEEPVGSERWFGKLLGDIDAFDLMDGTAILRLPSGRSAEFRPSRTDLVLPRGGVEITGAGPPPI